MVREKIPEGGISEDMLLVTFLWLFVDFRDGEKQAYGFRF
jgi:hypothetical protein